MQWMLCKQFCWLNWIQCKLSARNLTGVVYVDFSRAFDSVVHSKLIYKLQNYGIEGKLLNWITSFLSNRSQRVVLDNTYFTSSPVLSGVVQGSVLGPLLFLIFINELITVCNGTSELVLFADDVKLYTIASFDTASIDLQNSLDELYSWSEKWQLSINISKCHFMTVHNQSSSFVCRSYHINHVEIAKTASVNDLGILMQCNLNFSTHISNIITKASQRCAAFFRGFVSRDLFLVRKFFIVYIRPLLEYNTCIWNPTKRYLINKLESVQRHFTKRFHHFTNYITHSVLKPSN